MMQRKTVLRDIQPFETSENATETIRFIIYHLMGLFTVEDELCSPYVEICKGNMKVDKNEI